MVYVSTDVYSWQMLEFDEPCRRFDMLYHEAINSREARALVKANKVGVYSQNDCLLILQSQIIEFIATVFYEM